MRPTASDELDLLDPPARAPGARVRLGVGAAVVLVIVALVAAVLISLFSQEPRVTEVAPAGTDTAGSRAGSTHASPPASPPENHEPGDAAIIFVHLLGSVRRPGLLELTVGARVMDAVAAAGGLTETADPAGVNLARVLADGEQVYIPRLGEAQPGAPPGIPAGGGAPGSGVPGGGPAGLKINLNQATAADLDTLPRIGPAMAQRIIDYRAANGRFGSVDDLRNVTGIGEKTFEALKDLVTV